jgi:hypothetical protein
MASHNAGCSRSPGTSSLTSGAWRVAAPSAHRELSIEHGRRSSSVASACASIAEAADTLGVPPGRSSPAPTTPSVRFDGQSGWEALRDPSSDGMCWPGSAPISSRKRDRSFQAVRAAHPPGSRKRHHPGCPPWCCRRNPINSGPRSRNGCPHRVSPHYDKCGFASRRMVSTTLACCGAPSARFGRSAGPALGHICAIAMTNGRWSVRACGSGTARSGLLVAGLTGIGCRPSRNRRWELRRNTRHARLSVPLLHMLEIPDLSAAGTLAASRCR